MQCDVESAEGVGFHIKAESVHGVAENCAWSKVCGERRRIVEEDRGSIATGLTLPRRPTCADRSGFH